MEKKGNNLNFTFIDLFAGIGGFRLAFEKEGGKCLFSCERDKFCQITYKENFGDIPAGDIVKIDSSEIPDHDFLVAGFPCQPFSIAGISKKLSLGLNHGFQDKKQGNLFFYLAKIIKDKRPKIFLLENVKHLKNHDKGKTYKIIKNTLLDLKYDVYDVIIDAKNYIPQHRERIFIVGLDRNHYPNLKFEFPDDPSNNPKIIKDILEKNPDKKYTLSDKLWKYLQVYALKHKMKGNGFGFGLVDPERDKFTRTLSARYYKDGSEILIKQDGVNPRRLTPRECARLMGFSDSFQIPVSDTQAYRQFGNSVVVPVVEALAKKIVPLL